MRRWVGLVTVGVGAAAAVAIGLAAAGASDAPGGPVGDRVPAPPDAAQAQHAAAVATAPATVIAVGDGVVVEAVSGGASSGTGATDGLRVTLQRGPFQVRDLPIVVRVDGRAIGRARPNADLTTATAVILDRSWLHSGATLTWSYGDAGPQTTAGTIGTVQG